MFLKRLNSCIQWSPGMPAEVDIVATNCVSGLVVELNSVCLQHCIVASASRSTKQNSCALGVPHDFDIRY